jgi:twinkle protein
MSGKFLHHAPCEACGSADNNAVYEAEDGSKNSYCFGCTTYVPDIEGTVTPPKNTPWQQKNPAEYPLVRKEWRGIGTDVYAMYGVRQSFNEQTGEPDAVFFPYVRDGNTVGWKKRRMDAKSFSAVGDMKTAPLFGSQVFEATGKMILVTEGEFDALAAHQMFKELGKNYKAVSLPNGANIRGIKDNLEYLEKFESVILCFDQDEAGQKLVDQAAGMLSPGKARIMRFDDKDANDMLIKGRARDFFFALNKSEPYRADGIVGVDDIWNDAVKPIERGLDWPWDHLSAVTYGRRRRELYGFGGGTGCGKTEALKQIIEHVIVKDNLPAGLIFLEEEPSYTLKVVAGKTVNQRFHVPDTGWKPEELKAALNTLRDKIYLYNHFGCKEWAQLKPKIRYMVVSLGIKDIFLDHLTALVAESDDVNGDLGKIMADMASMTQELDFTLYYISHLSTPTGLSHEEGGRVTVSQFRGSRTIGFWSHYLFGFERNQQHEDISERNTPTLRVLKDRYTGLATGTTIRLFYDHNRGTLLEKEEVTFDEDYESTSL